MTPLTKFSAVTVSVALAAGVSAYAAPRLTGAGASFPAQIYVRWVSEFAKAGGVKVNYQSVGSGSGRRQFMAETVDFGASDDPMKKKGYGQG